MEELEIAAMQDEIVLPAVSDEDRSTTVLEVIAGRPDDLIEKVAVYLKWNYGAVLTGQEDSDWRREATDLFALIGLSEAKNGR